ncbi:zinc ribbon domain-containing protein [Streptomyces sp. NPDC005808]|uniref:NADase-type glycan-binding domain-containing protein n=1 Tax=Streptomyces sp. NPDC005808 TaxID=3364734 RepID=UPI00367A6B1B
MTSQSCTECGTRAEPGQSFCDACGAVLGWGERAHQGERGDRAEAGRAAAADEPAGARAAQGGTPGFDAFSRPVPAGGGLPHTARERLGASSASGTSSVGGTAVARGASGTGSAPGTAAAARIAAAPAPAEPADPVMPTPGADNRASTSAAAGPAFLSPSPYDGAPGNEPWPAGDDTTSRARSLLVPVTDPDPRPVAEPSVAPVLPGRPVADRPQVRAPGREPGAEGGPPCPWCATPNRPDRHFCGRCAMSLAGRGSEAPGHLPWWRRLPGFSNGEIPWAGERPRLRRGFGRALNWVFGALVLSLLITAVVYADTAVGAVSDHFAKRAAVEPDNVSASRSYPGHKPELLFDKLSNTWWGPGITQSAEGEWVEARFAEPTRLLDVIITPGVSTQATQLSQSALPHRIEARVTTADGRTTTRTLTLDRGPGGQTRAFRVGDVTSVRFILRSAYGAAPDKQVAIAEIEFFGRSSSNS